MRQITLLFIVLGTCLTSISAKTTEEFSIYLTREPRSLDPTRQRGSGTAYLFANLYRGLYLFDDKKGLVPEGAKNCEWSKSKTTLTCELNNSKWSDGSLVEAMDYVRAFRRFISNDSKAIRAELLFNLVNARAIFKGEMNSSSLGIYAPSSQKLVFKLKQPDPEFLYTLTNPLLVPLKKTKFGPVSKTSKSRNYNGPYQVQEWKSGRSVLLKSNPHYRGKNRPNVRIYFIAEDSTALSMYESGRLDFLWRLPTKLIPAYRNREDFVRVEFARFDYLGFGPEFTTKAQRKSFALSLDYKKMQELYHAEGRPGCPALPLNFTDKEVCYPFDIKTAKKLYDQLSPKFQKRRLKLAMSYFGGSGNKTVAEWMQSQWRTHLGKQVDIQQLEQKYFLKMVRENPTSIFRKGVGLLRPTCSAALQTFTRGNRENYIKYENPAYDALVERLKVEESLIKKKKLCREGVELLMNDYALIPLGRMHFSLLVSKEFTGWRLNSLNQLDLANLRRL